MYFSLWGGKVHDILAMCVDDLIRIQLSLGVHNFCVYQGCSVEKGKMFVGNCSRQGSAQEKGDGYMLGLA